MILRLTNMPFSLDTVSVSRYSAGMCTIEGNTGTITATGTTSARCHYRLFPVCAKRLHRHYSGQPALLNRRYKGTPMQYYTNNPANRSPKNHDHEYAASGPAGGPRALPGRHQVVVGFEVYGTYLVPCAATTHACTDHGYRKGGTAIPTLLGVWAIPTLLGVWATRAPASLTERLHLVSVFFFFVLGAAYLAIRSRISHRQIEAVRSLEDARRSRGVTRTSDPEPP